MRAFNYQKLFLSLLVGALFLLCGKLVAQPCHISQPNGTDFANVSVATAVGQTFVACGDGVITTVGFRLTGTLGTDSLELELQTTGDAPSAYVQAVPVSANGDVTVLLDQPFAVLDGENARLSVRALNGEGVVTNVVGQNGNPYPPGNLFTETDGVVTNFVADLIFSLAFAPEACVLSQRETDAFSNITTSVAIGQRFTACGGGAVTALEMHFATADAADLQLRMSAGPNTLTPEYVQDFTVAAPGWIHLPLTTPFAVVDGETYAYTVIGRGDANDDTLVANISGTNTDKISGGNAILERDGNVSNFGGDETFALTIVENACVQSQPDQNAFLNLNENTYVGQTFTPCTTGRLSHVQFTLLDNSTTQLVRLDLNNGSNTFGPEYFQFFPVDGAGTYLLPLDQAFNVQAGTLYAFSVVGVGSEAGNVTAFNGNPYPGGNAFNAVIANGDTTITNFGTDLRFALLTFNDDGVVSTDERIRDEATLFAAVPNPARTQFDLRYALENSREVRLELYDFNGRLVRSLEQGRQPAGTYSENVSLEGLPAGTYHYGITTEVGRMLKKIVVVR